MATKCLTVFLMLLASSAHAAISVVAHDTAAGTQNSVTTSAFNTTSANLIVLSVAWYNSTTPTPTVSDSESNTWTKLTTRTSGANCTAIYYCASPATDASHTFTVSGSSSFPAIGVIAVSGAAASPFDQDSGAGTTQPGSITPSEDGCIVITSAVSDTTLSVAGWTSQIEATSGGVNMEGGIAYKIQTTATAENPTWTNGYATAMATFKAADEAGGAINPLSSTIPGIASDPLNSGPIQ